MIRVEGPALRLHFNRHGAAPLVWSIHAGNFELNVRGFFTYCPLGTVYSPKPTADDDDGIPSAWLVPVQTSRTYTIQLDDNGWATINYDV